MQQTSPCQQVDPIKNQLDQISNLKPITCQLVNYVVQEQWCGAIAFNNEGTIMAAGYEDKIKLWELDNGILKSTDILLKGHTGFVWCLVFSKKQNWFASGCSNGIIKCWKEITKNNWVSTRSQDREVRILLLNRNEDQVLSLSRGKFIHVWHVDCTNNILTYNYSLDKHTSTIFCLSLNESETSLVSSSTDNAIIIWGKNQLSKWQFKYFIGTKINDKGGICSFINDNLIVRQQFIAKTSFYELDHDLFKKRPNLQLELFKGGRGIHRDTLFKITYNKKSNILLQQHNKRIYILRQQPDGKFKVECETISCDSKNCIGGLTNNGCHLVIFNDITRQLRVYRINYE